MKQRTYETVKQFENDIKWFGHNCRSIYPHDRTIRNQSKWLIEFVKESIKVTYIVSCVECYGNACEYDAKKIVTQPCSKLHLLVWAKVSGNSYWPAKVIHVSDDKKSVFVQLFGDYTVRDLKITKKNCFLYSKEYPEKKSGRASKPYLKALQVSFCFVV